MCQAMSLIFASLPHIYPNLQDLVAYIFPRLVFLEICSGAEKAICQRRGQPETIADCCNFALSSFLPQTRANFQMKHCPNDKHEIKFFNQCKWQIAFN